MVAPHLGVQVLISNDNCNDVLSQKRTVFREMNSAKSNTPNFLFRLIWQTQVALSLGKNFGRLAQDKNSTYTEER